jgi:prephenate dehydrogenase
MKIGIIGLGLIGGTIAKTLNHNHTINAYDVKKEALMYALDNKIIHNAYYDLNKFLEDNNIIYLCLYPDMIIDFLKKNKDLIKNDSVLIEISGIKSGLIKQIDKLAITNFDIIYSHPIAGRELIGVEHSDKRIFSKGNYAIVEHFGNEKQNIDLTIKLAKEMGFKNVSIISAQLHDELIAYTSQLTHIISLALVNSFQPKVNLSHFTGDSYRDLTRIANINVPLWTDLFINNKDLLCERISDFQNQLETFKTAINLEDKVKLSELMCKAKNLHNIYLKERNNED